MASPAGAESAPALSRWLFGAVARRAVRAIAAPPLSWMLALDVCDELVGAARAPCRMPGLLRLGCLSARPFY